MFDLTGSHLAGYMTRLVRDVVARTPRFRDSLGEVALTSNNMVSYGDVQCIVKDISAQGVRLSPDYFMYTQMGRSLLARLGDKEGAFFEFANEIDPTLLTPAAGIYMFNVDAVEESTRTVTFTVKSYRWYEGMVRNAMGSRINFASGIDATTVQPYDLTTNETVPCQAGANFLYLLGAVTSLGVRDASGNPLMPNTDFWAEGVQSTVIIPETVFGTQTATVPASYESVALVDQDDFTLRPGIDYIFISSTMVQLAAWTPAGSTITATGTVCVDPTVPGNCINSENILSFTLSPGETLVADQVWVETEAGDEQPVTVKGNTVALTTPLPPGGWCRYDLRTLVGEKTLTAKKMAANLNLVPGMRIAVGDRVVPGDQCAIIVSPGVCETYHVYGSKDNVGFTLDIKANDPSTASELCELLKAELLIHRRSRIEADGLTILEASRSLISDQRDRSGTAPRWVASLSCSALADWRVFKPLVTRVTNFDITSELTTQPYPGKLKVPPRMYAVGAIGFLPDYR